MKAEQILLGKRVLIVDDEKDILELLVSLLEVCKIDAASSFEEAKLLLETHHYDIAILDIMGVNGFELLKIANSRKIPALMLTARALNVESLEKSVQDGAYYFVPKDEISRIGTYVADVLESIEKNQNPWIRWLKRLGGTFDVIFTGPAWREKRRDLMEKLNKTGW
ncbi:MAG: response regulator [Deltaproteobacteria bacterium HGW-Deltaproteobacteria-21]|jgi:DNA-binding NtrC family response regulator|nr:MAG: response regulator [Deltaproteobacteria bacterium HGW-Deltaproteobacteria-21]